jgi:hypothetical protein
MRIVQTPKLVITPERVSVLQSTTWVLTTRMRGEEIIVTLSRQLSWSHSSALLPISQPFQGEFYAEMCRNRGHVNLTNIVEERLGCFRPYDGRVLVVPPPKN